jgi:hypothetical protein
MRGTGLLNVLFPLSPVFIVPHLIYFSVCLVNADHQFCEDCGAKLRNECGA